jgi:hypothetical protein
VLSGNGLMLQAMKVIETIIENCLSENDQLDAKVIRIEVLACTNQLDQCLSEGKNLLSSLFPTLMPLNAGFTKVIPALVNIKRSLKLLTAEDILSLPECNDIRIQCAMKISKWKMCIRIKH